MIIIDILLQFWVETDWYIALLMSAIVNIVVFVSTAAILDIVIAKMITPLQWGRYIDNRALNLNQTKSEIKKGVVACVVLAICSLASRELFVSAWPKSLSDLAWQVIAFAIFYETYSYFIHRLLHTKPLFRIHGVHHRSVRVTPWSAYSVHPIEALFIGVSAPLFMSLFSLSLGVALVLHIVGMMFTILLHSNFNFNKQWFALHKITYYSTYHSAHHLFGMVNFGFTHSFWDRLFKTRQKE